MVNYQNNAYNICLFLFQANTDVKSKTIKLTICKLVAYLLVHGYMGVPCRKFQSRDKITTYTNKGDSQ